MTSLNLSLLSAVLLAIALSYVISALVQRWALQGHLLDVPNHRSSHTIPTPRGGGIGIALVTLIGVAVASALRAGAGVDAVARKPLRGRTATQPGS